MMPCKLKFGKESIGVGTREESSRRREENKERMDGTKPRLVSL